MGACADSLAAKGVPFFIFCAMSFRWRRLGAALRHLGRVVKAVDSKSTGLRPRRFESGRCRRKLLQSDNRSRFRFFLEIVPTDERSGSIAQR